MAHVPLPVLAGRLIRKGVSGRAKDTAEEENGPFEVAEKPLYISPLVSARRGSCAASLTSCLRAVSWMRRILEGSLEFRNSQQVATACGTHVPRQLHTAATISPLVSARRSCCAASIPCLRAAHCNNHSVGFHPLPARCPQVAATIQRTTGHCPFIPIHPDSSRFRRRDGSWCLAMSRACTHSRPAENSASTLG